MSGLQGSVGVYIGVLRLGAPVDPSALFSFCGSVVYNGIR